MLPPEVPHIFEIPRYGGPEILTIFAGLWGSTPPPPPPPPTTTLVGGGCCETKKTKKKKRNNNKRKGRTGCTVGGRVLDRCINKRDDSFF